jgi:hypothetical protein
MKIIEKKTPEGKRIFFYECPDCGFQTFNKKLAEEPHNCIQKDKATIDKDKGILKVELEGYDIPINLDLKSLKKSLRVKK